MEHIRDQSETRSGGTESTDAPTHERYRELERKFLNGSINEQEWNELLRLENILGQFDTLRKHTISDPEGLSRFGASDSTNAYLAGSVAEGYTRNESNRISVEEKAHRLVEIMEKYGISEDEAWAVKEYKTAESYKINTKLRDGIELTPIQKQ